MTWPKGISAELREQAHQHFSEAELVELVLDISKWSTQKVPVALGLDMEINPGGLALFDFDAAGKVVWGPPLST